ncbi:MAG: aldolase [Planctomycetota bacterium]|nr:MAG: aldolase [Planctomycetota bacterium]
MNPHSPRIPFMNLRTLIRSQHPVIAAALGQFCTPKFVEIMAMSGKYHALWLDQEHVGLTTPQIEDACRAARVHRMPTFVRLPATDYAAVMRPLEAGADGVMASMVRSLQEVKNLVHWAKFHPEGGRGVNGTGVDGKFGTYPGAEYFKLANERSFLAVQIEHVDALNVVEEIAAVPHLDLLFIGPADLSQSLGLPNQWEHPEMWKAIERVAKASQKHGVPWGILPRDAAYAQRCLDLGCRLLSIGMDSPIIQKGIRAYWEDWAPFALA